MPEESLKLEDLISRSSIEDDSERIKNVAIIGAGVMGQGIGQTIASAGMEVMIIEKGDKELKKAEAALIDSINREIKRWAMTNSEKKAILARIEWSLDIEKAADCDLIIEAVDEDYNLKVEIFDKLDKLANKHCIFASNTSTLSLTKISETTSRPDKMIGLHFLHPVPKIPVVEVVKCLHTSVETISEVKKFISNIGKTPVEVYEYPGFVTTRAIVPLLNEAMHILMEEVATAKDIDTAMKLGYNFQSGPLEMADSMGLDEVLTWMETLWSTLGEARYRACPLLRKLVRERKLGKKTGEGFYKYDAQGNIIS
ncbi:MAG TPA: 3-hydroxyacyl-CoA dehydrogenase NAD-binding domain-containing protein [Ignavibacteriaceae bacterium]